MAEPHRPTRAAAFQHPLRDSDRRALVHALAVVVCYALLCALFFSPVVFRARLLAPGDGTHFFVPNFYSPRVWWDSLIWAGTPRFADPSATIWYPLWLVCRLLPAGWNLYMLSAYTVAASATYGYVFRLTRTRLASAVSGTTYALSGFMIAHAVHATMIHAAAWLPLIIWSLEELRRSEGLRARAWFIIGALSVALGALAGHAQIFLYALALGAIVAVFRAHGARVGALKYLALCFALVVIGASVAALQLVPTAELSRLTPRAAITFEAFNAYSLPPSQLSTFLFPLVYGGAPRTLYALPYFGAWGSEGGGWNASEVTGYVGLLPLMLAAIALCSRRERGLTLLWLGVAVIALLLAFGGNFPLAHVTYHLPLFDKFRAPARHLCELSFAASILAGLGVATIKNADVTARQIRLAVIGASVVTLATLAALALTRAEFDAQARAVVGHIVSLLPLKNPAVAVPLVVLLASSASLLVWSRRTSSRARAVALLIILVCDLGSLGWFSEWRGASPTRDELAPPAVAVNLRDALDASGQRALAVRGGLAARDEVPPEQSRLWNIPSAGGYGPLMLARMSRLLLTMLPHGAISEDWTGDADRSLDVAAVRYVIVPRDDAQANNDEHADDNNAQMNDSNTPHAVAQINDSLNLSLGSSCNATRQSATFTLPAPARATSLAFVSQLSCGEEIKDGASVVAITLSDDAGHASALNLAAGHDTSEWAYDCADVRARVRHSRAPVFSTYATDRQPAPCVGHDYASEIALAAPFEIRSIELRWTGGDKGALFVKKLSLVDHERHTSRPVTTADAAFADATRWRLAAETDGSRVYENLRAQPRAWLVRNVVTLSADDALHVIKSARLPDGRAFDPAQTALVEEPQDFPVRHDDEQSRISDHNRGDDLDQTRADDQRRAQSLGARVVAESDGLLEVRTASALPAFLVLSDAYYPGWRASVDGRDAHLFLTDYALRGVAVPAGEHSVRFELRPRSFRAGLLITCAALFALVIFAAPFNPLWRARDEPLTREVESTTRPTTKQR